MRLLLANEEFRDKLTIFWGFSNFELKLFKNVCSFLESVGDLSFNPAGRIGVIGRLTANSAQFSDFGCSFTR